MKSTRHSEYHALVTLAVKMERCRKFKEAERLWNQARFLARKPVNIEYCSNRAEFCNKSRFTK
ncbi:ANR family transcriptional regulator [Salmonella enterica]|nr:ANR family transcriptional regulator [Salmonella enterica]